MSTIFFMPYSKKRGCWNYLGKGLQHMVSAISLPYKTLKNVLKQEKIFITGFSTLVGIWDTSTSNLHCTTCISPHSSSQCSVKNLMPAKKVLVRSQRTNRHKVLTAAR